MARKKKKDPTGWSGSEGRTILRQYVRDGRIPANMPWQQAFHLRPEFAVGPTLEEAERLFEGRLKSARSWVSKKQTRSDEEEAAMLNDRRACKPPPTNHRGEPRWEGSAAQRKLKEDVKNGKHLTMTNDAFYTSCPEYQQFFKATILGHVRQEESTIKFLHQYRGRYNEY